MSFVVAGSARRRRSAASTSRRLPGHPGHAGAPGRASAATTIRAPETRAEWVPRRDLVHALTSASDKRLVLLDAPVGYGKTTLLAQWRVSEQESRPLAWVTVERGDDDPLRLFARLGESVALVIPGFRNPAGLVRRVAGEAAEVLVAELANELAKLPDQVVVVLDDYHLVRSRRSHTALARLVDVLPPTCQLVVSTREDPPLPLARLRAGGQMLELRATQLAFAPDEAAEMLRRTAGVDLDPADLSALVSRTEGWPAGLYLAAMSLRGRPSASDFINRFAGDHRHVVDYLTSEVLHQLPEVTRRFLARTSVLDRFCAPLCDTVVGATHSAEMLVELERTNLFIVPLDDQRVWFRYHRLFADLMRSELSRTEPDLLAELHHRASRWFRSHGSLAEAVGHAAEAHDIDTVGELVADQGVALLAAGQMPTVRSWLGTFTDEQIAQVPPLSLARGWIAGLLGQRSEMDSWLATAQSQLAARAAGRDAPTHPAVALTRAWSGLHGVQCMLTDARLAVETGPLASPWRTVALLALGWAEHLSGDDGAAQTTLEEAVRLARGGPRPLLALALARHSFAVTSGGAWAGGTAPASEARQLVESMPAEDAPYVALETNLALGAALAGEGRVEDAAGHLEEALEAARLLPGARPWPLIEAALALGSVRFALADVDAARALLAEAQSVLEQQPDAGALAVAADRVHRIVVRGHRPASDFGETLSDREMAVLQLFPTHLTQREISRELFLSVNTVKTHARAIYRKLGVGSRQAAVLKARRLGWI